MTEFPSSHRRNARTSVGLEKIPHPALAVFRRDPVHSSTEERVLGCMKRRCPRFGKLSGITSPNPSPGGCTLDPPLPHRPHGRRGHCRYGEQASKPWSLRTAPKVRPMLSLLEVCLAVTGELTAARRCGQHRTHPLYSSKPFVFNGEPRRDERFPSYNMGLNAEVSFTRIPTAELKCS